MSSDTTCLILKLDPNNRKKYNLGSRQKYVISIVGAVENIVVHKNRDAIGRFINNPRTKFTHLQPYAWRIASEMCMEYEETYGLPVEYGTMLFVLPYCKEIE